MASLRWNHGAWYLHIYLPCGASASAVRDLEGHSSIAVTGGYAHAGIRPLREAISPL